MTVKEQLIAARELISDPEKWCGGGKPNPGGFDVEPTRREWDGRTPVCAMGAVKVTGGDPVSCFRALSAHVPRGVRTYNDTHSHQCTLAMFDAAIAATP